MTWLFEHAAEPQQVPVDLLADGLFAARSQESIQPLEFGPIRTAAAPAEGETEESAAARALQERTQQLRLMVDAARAEAALATRAEMEASNAEQIAQERVRVDGVLALFAQERARWFRTAEAQLVDLAIAIARCVLHREMALDPLSLRAIAHEAVTRVQDGSGVVLRVAPACVADWRGAFVSRQDLEVLADPAVPVGECVVDTSFGRVELGVNTQLEEVTERFRKMVGGPRRVRVSEGQT